MFKDILNYILTEFKNATKLFFSPVTAIIKSIKDNLKQ